MPHAGEYAINISYMSPGATGFLKIGINEQDFEVYPSFQDSGNDCYHGGSRTVVPVELKGFTKGMNSIRIDNDGEKQGPIIEWISVVVPTDA